MYTISTDVEIMPDLSLSSPSKSIPKWGFVRKSPSMSSSCILLMLPDGGVRILFSPVQVKEVTEQFPGYDVSASSSFRSTLPPNFNLDPNNTYYLVRRPIIPITHAKPMSPLRLKYEKLMDLLPFKYPEAMAGDDDDDEDAFVFGLSSTDLSSPDPESVRGSSGPIRTEKTPPPPARKAESMPAIRRVRRSLSFAKHRGGEQDMGDEEA